MRDAALVDRVEDLKEAGEVLGLDATALAAKVFAEVDAVKVFADQPVPTEGFEKGGNALDARQAAEIMALSVGKIDAEQGQGRQPPGVGVIDLEEDLGGSLRIGINPAVDASHGIEVELQGFFEGVGFGAQERSRRGQGVAAQGSVADPVSVWHGIRPFLSLGQTPFVSEYRASRRKGPEKLNREFAAGR